MAVGPGKYDDLATHVREQANASLVVLIVLDGSQGSGFAVQALAGYASPQRLIRLLRLIADEVERDVQ